MILTRKCWGRGYPHGSAWTTMASLTGEAGPQALRVVWRTATGIPANWNFRENWAVEELIMANGDQPGALWKTLHFETMEINIFTNWVAATERWRLRMQIAYLRPDTTTSNWYYQSTEGDGWNWRSANVISVAKYHQLNTGADFIESPLDVEIGYYNRMPANSCPP